MDIDDSYVRLIVQKDYLMNTILKEEKEFLGYYVNVLNILQTTYLCVLDYILDKKYLFKHC